VSLKGGRELNRRLRAIKQTFKPAGRAWAEGTVDLARPNVPVKTGKARRSLRVRNASMKRATVVGSFVALILDRGAKAHDIRARKAPRLVFQSHGRTIFAKKVHKPRLAGKHFAARAARESLRRNPMAAELVALWNRAA
jgi:hypothetical protein